jgi:hypothetical protein
MEIGAVEKNIMQGVLKSVKDYNDSIEMLGPAVKKYFKDNYEQLWSTLRGWKLINYGNEIEISYAENYITGHIEYKEDVVPTETIVSIAVELSFNKKTICQSQ